MTQDGITVTIGRPKHVRPGRKVKGGLITTVRVDARNSRNAIRIELLGAPGDISRVFLNEEPMTVDNLTDEERKAVTYALFTKG